MIQPIYNYKNLIKTFVGYLFNQSFIILYSAGIIAFLGGCASTTQQQTSNFSNYAYEYESNPPITIKHTATFNQNDYTIYLLINVRRLRTEGNEESFYKNINLGYKQRFQYAGDNIVEVDSIPASAISVQKVGTSYLCTFKISRNSNFPPILFINVADKRTDYTVTEDILLETDGNSNYWSGILFNPADSLPVFDHYIAKGGRYKILQEGTSGPVFVNMIKQEFPPAPAPMSTLSRSVQKNLDIDSVYHITTNQEISFDSSGLYLIQEDTSKSIGLGFRVEGEKYPKYTKLESLIKPLVYISTTEEIKGLTKSTEPKKAFDRYWLKHGGNANDGKRLIKVYYDRVEEANQKFTGYKEGWKTDMGMIYIIFGQPTFVYRNGEQEQWIYEKTEGMSQLKFTFVKIANLYSNNHFELIRYPEYEEFWYKKVDLWRKGVPGI